MEGTGKGSAGGGEKRGGKDASRLRNGIRQFPVGLRTRAGGQVVDGVRGLFFLMNRHDCFADIVRRYDIDFIVRTQRKNRHLCQNIERLNHIELRSFRAAAVAQNNGGAEKRLWDVGRKRILPWLPEIFWWRGGVKIPAPPSHSGLLRYPLPFFFPPPRQPSH